MSQSNHLRTPVIDWLTVVAISAIAISLNVGFHEGMHALSCLAVGGDLLEYSALYEECDNDTVWQAKINAGGAPTFNFLAGFILWLTLRISKKRTAETQYFLWLFMMMNWFYAAGYFIFSGIADFGDWAVVINGWQPNWVWRVLLTCTGILSYLIFLRLGLAEFGKMVGGEGEEQMQRANKLFVLPYITSPIVVLVAGLFCPYGFLSMPVTAGLFGVLGALSPFIYMIRWFRTSRFKKPAKEPLEIQRRWQWVITAVIVVFVYVYILGQTLYF